MRGTKKKDDEGFGFRIQVKRWEKKRKVSTGEGKKEGKEREVKVRSLCRK